MSPSSSQYWCSLFGALVEMTSERMLHIEEGHPDLLPEHEERIRSTLSAPDLVRPSTRRPCAWLFSRW